MAIKYQELLTLEQCQSKFADLVQEGQATLITMVNAEDAEWSVLNNRHYDIQLEKREVCKRMEQIVREQA